MTELSPKKIKITNLIRCTAMTSVGLLVYGGSLRNSFVWDDEEQLLNNTVVQSLDNLGRLFSSSSFNSGGATGLLGIYYKPLMLAAYAALWSMFGANPIAFHAFQLLLHCMSSILLAVFLSAFFSETLAWLLAMVFLVHPLNAECVLYVADLQDTLFFFFGILGMVALAKMRNERGGARALIVSACLLLSLLSKESGVLFVATAATYELLIRPRGQASNALCVGLAMTTAAYAGLRFEYAGLGLASGHLQPITLASFPERLLTMPKIFYFYALGFVFPKDLAIAQQWIIRQWSWKDVGLPLLSDFFIFGAIAVLVKRAGSRRAVFFALWVFFGLALHAQVFPLDLTVADRWFYFPMAGLLGLIGIGWELVRAYLPTSLPAKTVSGLAAAMVIATLAGRSYSRSGDWKDGLTLFSRDVALNPNAFDLQNNAGVELFRAGDIRAAKEHFEISVQLAPQWWTNWSNLGAVYERFDDEGRAEKAYRRSIESGVYYLAYENLAKLLIRQHRYGEALDFLQTQALPIFPNNQSLVAMRQYAFESNSK
ncbi:MAG: hypothetical protein P4M08_01110 [Oligoflexia bacterium]|nr:hypothetical protein [Oligoflexia bacterium]